MLFCMLFCMSKGFGSCAGPAKPQEMGVGPLRMWPGGLCVSRCVCGKGILNMLFCMLLCVL
jgi:hypothetical protein